MKKNQIPLKMLQLLSSTWKLFFNLSQILSLIQIFASSLKTHDYNNLTFEIHANKNQEIIHQKIMLLSP
jgi:hypothetical protein